MSFADQIAKDRGQPATVRIGTVLSVSPLVVSVQGAALTNVGSLTPNLVAGDIVPLLGQSAVSADGSSWLALGPITTAAQVTPNSNTGVQVMASVQANNTAAFANITGVTFTFIKTRANSRIFMQMAGSSFSTAIGTAGEFAVLLTSVTGSPSPIGQVLASFFYNVATTHLSWSGFVHVAGIPAGTYTIQGRFRLSVGVGSISFDTNDRISVAFSEVD
jgi:hypothetical protein